MIQSFQLGGDAEIMDAALEPGSYQKNRGNGHFFLALASFECTLRTSSNLCSRTTRRCQKAPLRTFEHALSIREQVLLFVGFHHEAVNLLCEGGVPAIHVPTAPSVS